MSPLHFYSIGFFGGPNIGDELLCLSVAHQLRQGWPDARLSVMTGNASVSARYTGLEAEFVEGLPPTPEFLAALWAHHQTVASADLLVIGGGGLIADRYSWGGLVRFSADAAWATTLGRRFVIVGVGALEIRRAWLRPLARFLCSVAAAIGCRDEESALRLRSYGDRDDVLVAPDLAHIVCSELLTGASPENFALINIREVPPISSSVVEQFCAQLLKVVDRVVLLAAEPSETEYFADFTAAWEERIRARINIVKPTTLAEAVCLIESARVVIAERFHVNLIAVHAARPLVAILYEEKVAKLVADLGPGHLESTIEGVSSTLAVAALDLEAPAWHPLLRGWRDESIEVFNRVVQSGLDAPPPTAKQRMAGFSIVVLILGITLLRAPLILLKRALFGRGNLDARNLGRRLKRMATGRG